MTSAGDLRDRIAFDRRADPAGGDNEEGDFVQQFIVWAKVQAKLGGEAVASERLRGNQPVTIVVRQSRQTLLITPAWRARNPKTRQIYDIKSVADPDGARAFVELLASFDGDFDKDDQRP